MRRAPHSGALSRGRYEPVRLHAYFWSAGWTDMASVNWSRRPSYVRPLRKAQMLLSKCSGISGHVVQRDLGRLLQQLLALGHVHRHQGLGEYLVELGVGEAAIVAGAQAPGRVQRRDHSWNSAEASPTSAGQPPSRS